jgi:DNA-binding transcriptional LysR family regulator
VVERLVNNEDDLVIMGTLPENLDLEAAYFLDNPLVVVAPPDHPLVGQKNIPLARLVEERFLAREPGSGTRAARTRLFAEHGLSIRPYMELGSSEAIKQAVMAGLGISVLSMHNLRLELKAGLIAVLDVEHFPMMRQWYAVHMKGKKLSATTRMFLDFLLQDGARIWQESQPHLLIPSATPQARAKKRAPSRSSG